MVKIMNYDNTHSGHKKRQGGNDSHTLLEKLLF